MLDSPFDTDPISAAIFRKWFGNADFGPPMAAVAMGGAALSAAGTIAGGNNALASGRAQSQEALFQAKQSGLNASSDIAAAQRRSFDATQKTNLLASTATARAGASGVNAGVGSAAENVGEIQQKGRYAAALDLWNGQNAATGELNRAQAATYQSALDLIGGQAAKVGSNYSAAGTIAGGAASAYKLYNPPPATPAAAPVTMAGILPGDLLRAPHACDLRKPPYDCSPGAAGEAGCGGTHRGPR